MKKLRKLSDKEDHLILKQCLSAKGGSTSLHILKVDNGHKLYYRSDDMGHYQSFTVFVSDDNTISITDEYYETPETEHSWTFKLVKRN